MAPKSWHLSRRTFLHGVGAAVGLPLFEAMVPVASAASRTGKPPVRLGIVYVPHGVPMKRPKPNLKERAYLWTPKGEGADYKMSPILEPLEPNRKHFSVLSGLAHLREHRDNGLNLHSLANGMLLTGNLPDKAPEPHVTGVSVDQFAATKLGHATPMASLEIGTTPAGRGHTPKGYYNYSNAISYRAPDAPLPCEINPKILFERLFRGRKPLVPNWENPPANQPAESTAYDPRKSVLDSVLREAQSLRRRLGKLDQLKLDQYLASVRAVEKRIDFASRQRALQEASGAKASKLQPELPAGDGMPADFDDHVKIMADLMALAFQTDQTRICTFMFTNELSGDWQFSNKHVNIKGKWHDHAHAAFEVNRPEAIDAMVKVSRYHCALFNYMLDRMSSIEDGEASLLDNSILLYCSGLGNGGNHELYDLPVLLAGRGGGTLKPGRHIDYDPKKRVPMSNLYVELLNRIGVPVDQFGSSDGGVSDLS